MTGCRPMSLPGPTATSTLGVAGYQGFCQRCVGNADCAPNGRRQPVRPGPAFDRARHRGHRIRGPCISPVPELSGRHAARDRRLHQHQFAPPTATAPTPSRSPAKTWPSLTILATSASRRAELLRGRAMRQAPPTTISCARTATAAARQLPATIRGRDLRRDRTITALAPTLEPVRRALADLPDPEGRRPRRRRPAAGLHAVAGVMPDCGDAGLKCLTLPPDDALYGGPACLFSCDDPRFPGCANLFAGTPICDVPSGLCGACETDQQCRSQAAGSFVGPFCLGRRRSAAARWTATARLTRSAVGPPPGEERAVCSGNASLRHCAAPPGAAPR